MKNKDIVKSKDLKGLFVYIINNMSLKDIDYLTKNLIDYKENGLKGMVNSEKENILNLKVYPNSLTTLALRDEVLYYLENKYDDNINSLKTSERDNLVNTIVDEVINYNDTVWDDLYSVVDYKINDYFKESEDD